MKIMRAAIALLFLVAGSVGIARADRIVPPHPGRTQSDTRRYVPGPSPYTYLSMCVGAVNGGVSEVCFPHSPAHFVRVSIEDASRLPIAGHIAFEDFVGNWVNRVTFCGKSSAVRVPPEWRTLRVFLAGPSEAVTWCGLDGNAATTGLVRAKFSE